MTAIEQSVWLPRTPEESWALFTERAGAWWPPDRRHTTDPKSELFILASGRFFERANTGVEVELGRVTAWEPPSRLLLDFYVGTDPAHPTRVEVRFEPEREGTRVRIHHGPTEASAELYHQRAPRFEASWRRVLACLDAYSTGAPVR